MRKLLFVFISFSVFSQEKVQFLDAENRQPVAYAAIALGEGFGGYTDFEGYFTFQEKQTFTVSMLGYKTLNVTQGDFKEVIFLEAESLLLDEVTITKKSGKRKVSKQKPYWKNATWLDAFTPQIGNEIAVLIPNEKKQEMTLSKISIPIATNPFRIFDKESRKNLNSHEELPYAIVRIRFYSNENNKPYDVLYSDEIIANIHNFNNKFSEIDLESYNIDIPENGLFVGIEFIGFADKNQKYVYFPNYRLIERHGKKIKSPYPLGTCIPIDVKKNKSQQTFIRYSDWDKGGEKLQWLPFTEEKFLKLNSEIEKRKGSANIGLGYELKVYE
ncbi:MAG: carboxypeptidase-like regulatory domain-containing protein [Flavobacteriaceae bacterium]